MLRILTRSIRRRAAHWLVLTYLACVIGPPVALTFADPATAAHCLSDDHMAAPVHVHGDGAVPDHAMHEHAKHGSSHGSEHKHADGKATPVNCCGMFCVTGATVDMTVPHGRLEHGRILQPRIEASLGGIGPHRLDRPPNAL